MPGTLQVGGNTVITHTGDAGAGTNTINNAVVFPAGHIVQTVFNTHSAESSFTSTTPTAVANLTKPITLKTDNPYVLVILACLLYTSPSPRDRTRSRMPSSA